MRAEWENPGSLVTPSGTLDLNETDPATGWRFQLDPAGCSATLPVRSTSDDAPQDHGQIPHRRWRGGYVVHMSLQLLLGNSPDNTPACGADLVGMLDLLGLHLNEMIQTGIVPGSPNARHIWTPTGQADRMFDRCQLLSVQAPALKDGITVVEFDFDTMMPYYVSAFETQTPIRDGETVTVTNGGSVDFKSVMRVYGSFGDGFSVTNLSVEDLEGNPLRLVYDSALPGAAAASAPDYIEIAFGGATAYLNGNQASMKEGIDFRYTDFFPLVPGANDLEVEIAGADSSAEVLVLSNDAWA